MNYDVKDVGLAASGGLRIDYAWQQMPVLRLLERRFSQEKPLKGIRLSPLK
jgi:adenosylhomocysteinase